MIETFYAENYGCLKGVSLRLTPVHALIGPNDSGKSTILQGLRTLGHFARGKFESDGRSGFLPFDPRREFGKTAILRAGAQGDEYTLTVANDHPTEICSAGVGSVQSGRRWTSTSPFEDHPELHAMLNRVRGARLARFDPDVLRRPSGLVPENEALSFTDDRGAGLPGVYQSIQGRGDDAFTNIRETVRELFPTVKGLRVTPITRDQLILQTELTDGTLVPADRMSEGLLYFLAFSALAYLAPTAFLLVEEPENGLHPSRIREVVRTMREVSKRTGAQVVMATHSPLVINCLESDEVTIVTRPSVDEGTVVTRMEDTPNFEKRSSVYALGELWLSYADGKVEKPLLETTPGEKVASG